MLEGYEMESIMKEIYLNGDLNSLDPISKEQYNEALEVIKKFYD